MTLKRPIFFDKGNYNKRYVKLEHYPLEMMTAESFIKHLEGNKILELLA